MDTTLLESIHDNLIFDIREDSNIIEGLTLGNRFARFGAKIKGIMTGKPGLGSPNITGAGNRMGSTVDQTRAAATASRNGNLYKNLRPQAGAMRDLGPSMSAKGSFGKRYGLGAQMRQNRMW